MQGMRNQHGYQPLQHVTDQCQRGGLLAAQACDVGCPRVARALGARIGQPHQLADNDGCGDRAEQVTAGDQQNIYHHGAIEIVHGGRVKDNLPGNCVVAGQADDEALY